jgi:hypothetical protein
MTTKQAERAVSAVKEKITDTEARLHEVAAEQRALAEKREAAVLKADGLAAQTEVAGQFAIEELALKNVRTGLQRLHERNRVALEEAERGLKAARSAELMAQADDLREKYLPTLIATRDALKAYGSAIADLVRFEAELREAYRAAFMDLGRRGHDLVREVDRATAQPEEWHAEPEPIRDLIGRVVGRRQEFMPLAAVAGRAAEIN